MNNSDLIDRLMELCGTTSLTEVAKKTGVPYNTLKNYTSGGGRMPSAEVLIQIAASTGVNLNWLLLGRIGKEVDITTSDTLKTQTGRGARILDIEIPSFTVKVRVSMDEDCDEAEDIPMYISASPHDDEEE